jgi:hypothetical protein
LLIRDPTMNENPASSSAFKLATNSTTWICGSTRPSLLIPTLRKASSFSASKCSAVTS